MSTNDSIPVLISALRNRIAWEQELDIAGYAHVESTSSQRPAEKPSLQSRRPSPVYQAPVYDATSPSSTKPSPVTPSSNPVAPGGTTSSPANHSGTPPVQATTPSVQLKNTATNQAKAKALSELKFELEKCTQCALHQNRKRTIFSDGTMNADLAFVGDTPSKEEELVSLPFVGARGHLLNKIILAIGYRRETSYLCNVIKCAPQKNMAPGTIEFNTCGRHLLKQLQLVSPKVVVALGQTAASYLLGSDTPIDQLRGTFCSKHNMQIMPTYSLDHMLSTPASKRDVWEDMKLVKQFLAK